MSLKGSKTEGNLKAAFAGESQANRRYLYFAQKADVEGYNDVAAVFRSTAEGETGHAHGHLEYLEAVGDPATGLPFGGTALNLKSAIAGETHEYSDMYPGMAKEARGEGFDEIADWFETLAKAERSHANRFTKALTEMARYQAMREGSLEAPTRHPLDWKSDDFWNQDALNHELERVFDHCHGCRRCVSLCQSFPLLFDLVDNSPTMEVNGVAKADFGKVVDQCYLCDLCYQTKCPYIPPHEWNIDFPQLMLRAKAVGFRRDGAKASARLISNTRLVGKLASIPVVVDVVNWANNNSVVRGMIEKTLDVHRDAQLPAYHSPSARARLKHGQDDGAAAVAAGPTSGKVAIFITCYGDYSQPKMVEDLAAVLRHNGVAVKLLARESCCGMPKLELGDLGTVEKYKNANLPLLAKAVDEGWDLIAPIPSCVLMFKQEIPLMFPGDESVQKVKRAFFDPFEYLMHRHAAGLFKTDFRNELGKIAWQVACHQRVQNIGPKTREVLNLVPNTEVVTIERCSGHDGTYGVKKATYELSRKIAKPVEIRVKQAEPAHFTSDCVMAGAHIAHGLADGTTAEHPISLIRKAYGL